MTDVAWEIGGPPYFVEGAYESPLERLFAHHAVKYFKLGLDLQTQVGVVTPIGRFRLDFVVDTSSVRVGFECDGAAYHEALGLWARDRTRDEAILRAGRLDAVVRLPGRSLVFRPEDCFYVLRQWYAELFADRAGWILEHLASAEVKTAARPDSDLVEFPYRYEGPSDDPPDIARFSMHRRRLH
ncbi:MAG TPA: hypothetical protein VNG04_08560, partial [Candidatus Acidoferrum sp.]|nr:hypothetical protein [Candidatus Acidoferrum sp.]